MKTKRITLGALLLSASLLSAQAPAKKATVRIKTVENINGVETVKDSTYTTDNPADIKVDGANISIIENGEAGGGRLRKTIVIKEENKGDNNKDDKEFIFTNDSTIKMDGKLMVIEKSMHKDGKPVIIKEPGSGNEIRIMVLKNINITDATEADIKAWGKTAGLSDNKLQMDNMDFYPNPNNGKFNLKFNLKGKGNTEITVMNLEGKVIYNEKLNDFTGAYDKEIDISNNPKGTYFVRLVQGQHSQLKKIVLE